jgi:LysM repeat protein
MLKDLIMMKSTALKSLLMMLIVLAGSFVNAQDYRITAEEYIDKYYEIAVKEMQRTGIPASIKLAQGLFETGFGNSRLAREANNHFGIKCHKEWSGPTISEDDDAPQECFRVYTDPFQSYIDHSSFLMTRPRYSNLFNFPSNDYKSWAHGLKQAGYATNPNYGNELIIRIERFELFRFDDPEYVHVPRTQPTLTASIDKNVLFTESPLQVAVQNASKLELEVCTPVSPSLQVCKVKTTFNNGIKATKSVAGDTPRELAARAGVDLKTFMKYNECHADWLLPEGTFMYLSPKASKNNLATSYQVKPGDNMWLISQRYGVKEATLRSRNKLGAKEEPAERQIVFINKKTNNKPQVTKTPVILATHRYDKPIPPVVEVQRPVERLVAANNESAAVAEPVYQVIELPKTPSPQATVYQDIKHPVQSAHTKTHLVQPKETLYGISRMYGVTIDQLVEWNRLPDYNISIGALLIVGK